ncbi:hypothetical protein [Puerhibacterium puerhi]|uniref:hypothetical protein n=1 Tax=Puerhibacterium puerhi TaxID=2692623 RepID=UPI00191557B5|nr:hypothetical protein [Puerhibacterium puerhi]
MASPILRYFEHGHLSAGPLRTTSARFHGLALEIDETLPDGPEKSVALRKLLEAKDAAVRAALDLPPEIPECDYCGKPDGSCAGCLAAAASAGPAR